MQTIDSSQLYLIGPPSTSTSSGSYVAADSLFNLILVEPSSTAVPGASNPLQFHITPSPYITNAVRWMICTNITLGDFCMDQWGTNATQPALQRPGFFTGQQWTLTPDNDTSPTQWQMQSDFAGPLNFLSTRGEGLYSLAMLSDAPTADTNFEFFEVESVPISSPSTSTATSPGTTRSTSASSTWTPSIAANAVPDSPAITSTTASPPPQVLHKSSLSSGAKAGIGIGVAIAVVGALVAAVLLWLRRRRRSRQPESRAAFEIGSSTVPNRYMSEPVSPETSQTPRESTIRYS